MTGVEMLVKLRGVKEDVRNHPAWENFKLEMRDKDYSSDALTQAWHFFKAGWEAREVKQ